MRPLKAGAGSPDQRSGAEKEIKIEICKGEKSEMQTSESFRLSAILSFSGGLQDAYTYNVRGNVFANAQTGNVVLMSQNFMMKNWNCGIHYMLPLISFAAGVFITEQIELKLYFLALSDSCQLTSISLPTCWFPLHAPCRFRHSEKYMVTDMPVQCVLAI